MSGLDYAWEGDGYDPEADPVDFWSRHLTGLKASRRRNREQAEYLSRPYCCVLDCGNRQTATGPYCMRHFIESIEFGAKE